jgi:hypothetical protein
MAIIDHTIVAAHRRILMRKLLAILIAVAIGAFAWTRRRARAAELESTPADTSFMLAMHNAFRRDLDHLEHAIRAPESSREGWMIFREELEFHHHAEDDDLWPDLRARLAWTDDMRIVDEMTAEHAQIPPALDAVADGFDGKGDLEASVDALVRLVRDHLRHEEEAALPLVERHLTDADWHRFLHTERRKRGRKGPQFLSWVLDDATPADRAAVLRELPPPGRLVYRRIMEPRWRARQRWAPDATDAPQLARV